MSPSLHVRVVRATALALCLWLAAAAAPCQEPPPTEPPADPVTGATEPVASFGERVDVRVVNLDVYVTGRDGEPVVGLTRADFELKVDGRPMEITNFHSEAEGKVRESVPAIERESTPDSSFRTLEEIQADPARRPYVVLYVDNTRLRQANRLRAFKAVREMLGSLDPDALVAVVSLGRSLVFHSDFLFDRGAVAEILDELERSGPVPDTNEIERRRVMNMLQRGQSGGIMARSAVNSGELMASIRAYAAEEYQRSVASLRSIDRVVSTMAGAPGRKAMIYVGEGIPTRPGEGMYVEWVNRTAGGGVGIGLPQVDFNSDYDREVGNFDLQPVMDQVASRANDAGVTLYAVDAEDNHGFEMRSALTEQGAKSEAITVIDENYRAPLEFATQATGGKLLRSSGKLAEQLTDVVDDFDTFYSIGFRQPADWQPGSEHDVNVDVEGRGRRVRHRATIRIPQAGEVEARATVAALLFQTLDNPLGIQATPGSEVPRDDGTAALPVLLEIPVGGLGVIPNGETQAVSLSIYVTTRDAEGNYSGVQKIPFHLDIPTEKLEEARQRSAHYSLPLVLRKGDRQVAIGIRDDVSGAFSAVRIDVARFTQSL